MEEGGLSGLCPPPRGSGEGTAGREERGPGGRGSLTECFAETGWGSWGRPTHEASPGSLTAVALESWGESQQLF